MGFSILRTGRRETRRKSPRYLDQVPSSLLLLQHVRLARHVHLSTEQEPSFCMNLSIKIELIIWVQSVVILQKALQLDQLRFRRFVQAIRFVPDSLSFKIERIAIKSTC
jgi:hypothetical protein